MIELVFNDCFVDVLGIKFETAVVFCTDKDRTGACVVGIAGGATAGGCMTVAPGVDDALFVWVTDVALVDDDAVV